MKYGVRKPNIKKSIKARTTGKVKRQMKKAVNPLYGKKGMGVINNPKRAAYNAVYNRTTIGVTDIAKKAASHNKSADSVHVPAAVNRCYSDRTYKISSIILTTCGILLAILGLLLLFAAPVGGVIAIMGGIVAFAIGRKYKKIIIEHAENKNDIEEV